METPPMIPGYRLERRIGRGGTSSVYAATSELSGAAFAIKVLREDLCRDPALIHRFRREGKLLGKIAHPSIIPVVDSGCDSGRYYLVMPLVTVPTLAALLESAPPAVVPGEGSALARILLPVLIALDAVHQQGVVHRDLTPANIFVEDGKGLIADFGIVKILGSESLLTQSGALLGTMPYMAPEQLSGEPVDPRTDVYQTGLILYHMVLGRLPFERTLSDVVRAKCLVPALPDPRELGARICDRLAALILKATAREAHGRFGSAVAMAAALERALEVR